jgi:pSer/pThr/pTyr-binding forkhead associated (FHA) protein
VAELVIYEDETSHHIFQISTDRVLIGSSPDSQLILDSESVASAHVSLEFRQTYWVIQDLGSEQGTTINGEKINEPRPLDNDDLIEVGDIKLEFHDDISETTDKTERYSLVDEIQGRIWFARVAGVTLAVIMVILLGLIATGFDLENLLTVLR